jgi:acyl-homoserine lactone acylase PvdQ
VEPLKFNHFSEIAGFIVQAQDRLFQIELGFRLGEGRLAEIAGPELVASDRVFRRYPA